MGSDFRLLWDPHNGPTGGPDVRRAIQISLRGEVMAEYAKESLLDGEDISDFVMEQRALGATPYDRLVTLG